MVVADCRAAARNRFILRVWAPGRGFGHRLSVQTTPIRASKETFRRRALAARVPRSVGAVARALCITLVLDPSAAEILVEGHEVGQPVKTTRHA